MPYKRQKVDNLGETSPQVRLYDCSLDHQTNTVCPLKLHRASRTHALQHPGDLGPSLIPGQSTDD